MTSETPHKESFYHATIISNIQKWFIIIGSLLSLFAIFTSDNKKKCIDITICLISIICFILDFVFSYFYQKAGEEKVKDLVDNGLNSKLSDYKSKDYYTNDEIKNGLPKLGVNNFESVFFTKSIVRKMIKRNTIPFVIIFLIYICSIFFFEKEIWIKIFQFLLPLQIMKEFIYLLYFYSKIKDIYEDYKKVYSTTKKNERVPYIIKNIILYEKLLSTYQVLTDSKIYRKLNNKLSQDWIEVKREYCIE